MYIFFFLFLLFPVLGFSNPKDSELFEKYIYDLQYAKEMEKFSILKNDTADKTEFLSFFFQGCLKMDGVMNYVIENSEMLEKNGNISLQVYTDSLGNIIKTEVSDKKIESKIDSMLKGKNFFDDYFSNYKVNGICISKAEFEPYKHYFLEFLNNSLTISNHGGSCGC